jgi:hypothetical protein
MTRVVTAGVVALLVLLAGCGGGIPGGTDGGDGDAGDGGTVNFYISDQQNAIDDFEHLNVTVTEVGLYRVNESGEGDDESEGEWLTYEAGNATFDLTELLGANASRVAELPVPNGTYTQVHVETSAVDGTLKSGDEVDVKLPSERLRVNHEFTVGNGEEIDFVFDATVFETGNGRYILKPVASEAGTDKEIAEKPGAKRGGNQGGQAETDDENRQGQVDFYVSDEKNAIGDFAHLNVTITKVGLHEAGEGDGEESESADEGTENETETDGEGSESETDGNETDAEDDERDSESESEDESESESEDGEREGWVEQDVDSATLDLTTLQGANASRISELDAPAGTYDKVFVYVSEIDGTLTNGEQVNVKLPSNKLQMKKSFEVSGGETVEFVYDISVFKAGNSGKYILKPVVSESGTSDEVEIEKRGGEDERESEEEEEETEDDEADGEDETDLNATVTTDVTAGENATLSVTRNGSAVANATVEVNDETVGQTDADGTLPFLVPSDAEELEVTVTKGDMEAELSRDLSEGAENETEGGAESGGETTAAA